MSKRFGTVLLLLAVVAGCAELTGPSAQRKALQAEYAAWQAQGIQDYDVAFQQLCFCGPDATAKVTLQVRNNVLTTVLDSAGNSVPSSRWYTFKSINDIFENLIAFAGQPGAEITDLTFDSTLHYVTHVSTNIRNTADAGYTITTSGLRRSPR